MSSAGKTSMANKDCLNIIEIKPGWWTEWADLVSERIQTTKLSKRARSSMFEHEFVGDAMALARDVPWQFLPATVNELAYIDLQPTWIINEIIYDKCNRVSGS
jgi:hypothetical protein